MVVGMSWAMLECVEIKDEYKPAMLLGPDGKPYASGSGVWIKQYVFKCHCGKTVNMDINDFPGKRRMLDCGCGTGGKVGGPSSVRALSLPTGMWVELDRYADDNGMTLSGAVQKMLRLSLPSSAD